MIEINNWNKESLILAVLVWLITVVCFLLQANRDPKKSHTHRVMETKVKLEVDDMRYLLGSKEDTKEIRTEGI